MSAWILLREWRIARLNFPATIERPVQGRRSTPPVVSRCSKASERSMMSGQPAYLSCQPACARMIDVTEGRPRRSSDSGGIVRTRTSAGHDQWWSAAGPLRRAELSAGGCDRPIGLSTFGKTQWASALNSMTASSRHPNMTAPTTTCLRTKNVSMGSPRRKTVARPVPQDRCMRCRSHCTT